VAHVFLSYVRENGHTADRLAEELKKNGVMVWTDYIDSGIRWRDAIKTAIRSGGFFLPCFSKEYSEHGRTYMNKELALAIDELRRTPSNRQWFIPILLDRAASIPRIQISSTEDLSGIHAVNLYEDWNEGIKKIIQAVIDRPVLQIFLCHASEDKEAVRTLYRKLLEPGFAPWLDEEKLLPGQDWDAEITKAIRASDVVLVCLSQRSEKRGYMQKEIVRALDVADEQPEGTIFLIPVRLEDCSVPERLRRWQWVNLFQDDGFERLQASLRIVLPAHKF